MIMPTEFREHAETLYYNGDPDAALALMRIEWDRETLNSFGYLLEDLSYKIEAGITILMNQFSEAVQKTTAALNDMMAQL